MPYVRHGSRPRTMSFAIGALALCLASASHAATTDISPSPLASSTTLNVLPNILFTLDDSGSMTWDFLPDYVDDSNGCKPRSGGSTNCFNGDPPFYAAQFNGVYYNPEIRYAPAMNADGTLRTSYGSPWTSVPNDAYLSGAGTINLTTSVPELRYCNSSGVCKRNGVDTTNPFEYRTGNNLGYPDATYNVQSTINGPPFYFTIEAKEYCSDAHLTTCILSAAPSGLYTFSAPVRFCSSSAHANNGAAVSGAGTCQAKFTSTYKYARYGKFKRTDIVPATTSYPKGPLRTDCAGATCTYAEEMTNYANWRAYYRTRMQMMKTATGYAFASIDDRFRVGLVTINPGNPVLSNKYLPINNFNATQKSNWYTKLYSQSGNNSTPLRTALSRAGRHFAGKLDGINTGMSPDPVQHSCQQNFLLLTTDGFWNGGGGVKIDGSGIGNEDAGKPRPYYDGPSGTSTSDTLADAAYYYYNTDLRPSGSIGALGVEVSEDNVRPGTKDTANWQHMTTFTLGLVDGLMTWKDNYENVAGDYQKIRDASSGCTWAAGTCEWPKPVADSLTALDDLWHAAVNGRGLYFNARDPSTLADGLNKAMTTLQKQEAAGAAAATSTPIITQSDRTIFRSSYETVSWTGQVEAQLIDESTGEVLSTPIWKAHELLDGRVGASTDSRAIYTYSSTSSGRIKEFRFTNLLSTEKSYFENKCVLSTNLTQCPTLPSTDLATANNGEHMVNYLRGQKQHEGSVFRTREHVLGDTVNAVPLYIAKPTRLFADSVTPAYADWKASSAVASRPGVLYVGANDGMLHAFNGASGVEMWAYVPKFIMPNMYKLAEENYAGKHIYLVDGSPAEMDVYDGSTWRTILVSGVNSGGRGFFALDVTDPTSPKALWEFCHDATLCDVSDADLGYSYAKPVITKLPSGQWVVLLTSGYNNVSPGTGKGYLYALDAITGSLVTKVSNNQGSTTSPSGLGRIAAWADNFAVDNTAKVVYGGDMDGYIWRFDLTIPSIGVHALGRATDSSGKPQPITTSPELGLVQKTHHTVFVGTGRYLGVKDLSDPAAQIPAGTNAWQQSIYAIKDTGSPLGTLRSAGLIQQTILGTTGSGTTRSITQNTVNWSSDSGWYVDLPITTNATTGAAQSERVNVDPLLMLGTLIVATNVPGSTACAAGGEGWLYQFDFNTGSFVSTSPGEVVATKQTGALIVGFVVYQLPGAAVGQVQRSDSGMEKFDPHFGGSGTGRRVSWKEITQ